MEGEFSLSLSVFRFLGSCLDTACYGFCFAVWVECVSVVRSLAWRKRLGKGVWKWIKEIYC